MGKSSTAVTLMAAALLAALLVPQLPAAEAADGVFLYLAPDSASAGALVHEAPNTTKTQNVSKNAPTGSSTHTWTIDGFGGNMTLTEAPTATIHLNVAGTTQPLSSSSPGRLRFDVTLEIGANESRTEQIPVQGTGDMTFNVTFNFTSPVENMTLGNDTTVQLTTAFHGLNPQTQVRYQVNSTRTPSHVFLPGDPQGDGDDGGGSGGPPPPGSGGGGSGGGGAPGSGGGSGGGGSGGGGNNQGGNNTTGNGTDNKTGNGTADECPPEGGGGGGSGPGSSNNTTGNGTGNETGNGSGNASGDETNTNGTGNASANSTSDPGRDCPPRRFPLGGLDDDGDFLSGDENESFQAEEEDDRGDPGVPGFGAAWTALALAAMMGFVALRRRRQGRA